jgi:endonuclease YncB( thermonuclease family)
MHMPGTVMLPKSAIAAIVCLVASWCAHAQAQDSPGRGQQTSGTASVVDGATIDIRSDRFRLWGIDTPERGAWCYRYDRRWKPMEDSKIALRRCVEGKTVTCRVQKIDRVWFRQVHFSECWTDDGQDVGECMIRGGWATDYTCFSGGYYRDLETEAKNKGLGLWQCDNGPPTKRWGRRGPGINCESPVYRPTGPR